MSHEVLPEGAAERWRTVVAISSFTACSSTMLVVNKVAITAFPAPNSLLFCQLFVSSLFFWCGSVLRLISLDKIPLHVAKSYLIVSLTFLAALFSNMKILQYANVETFIVFRSSTPILISLLDYLFLGRELPSRKSFLSLLSLLIGAIVYTCTDSHFEVRAYFWVFCWYLVFCFDQIYIKRVVDGTKLSSWSSSFYTNSFAAIPALLCALSGSERDIARAYLTDRRAVSLVLISCSIGVMMSVSSFHLRSLVSATYFTVIGTICKILSVLINYMMWEKHASPTGLLALAFCIGSASTYTQAPLRQNDGHSTSAKCTGLPFKYFISLFVVFFCLSSYVLQTSNSFPFGVSNDSGDSRSVKTLVIVIGSIRGGHYAWTSFQTNLLGTLHAHFAYLGPDDPNLMAPEVHYNWHYDDLNDWGDFFDDMVEPSMWRHLCSEFPPGGAQFLGGVRNCQEGSAALLLAYRELLYRIVEAQELYNIYDWFVLTRSDQLHLCKHQALEALDTTSIYIAEGEDYGGVSDRHTIYPASLFLTGLGVTRALMQESHVFVDHFNKTGDHMNLESVLKFYFSMRGLHVQRSHRTFFGVIRQCDKTRWSSGTSHLVGEKMGFKVKYLSELQVAETTCAKNLTAPKEPIVRDCRV